MRKIREDETTKPYYDVLFTLTYKDDAATQYQDESQESSSSKTNNAAQSSISFGLQMCSLCGVRSHTLEEQRSHNKSDLHSYNLKQKIQGRKIVAEDEFEDIIGDLSESISGSDSSEFEEDEDRSTSRSATLSALFKKQATLSTIDSRDEDLNSQTRDRASQKLPFVYFTSSVLPVNTYLAIYRSLFTNIEQENESLILESLKKKQLTPKTELKGLAKSSIEISTSAPSRDPHFFLCMIGGGHFAAMMVSLARKTNSSTTIGCSAKEITVLAHKTFHRYTTRRKQGGAQSANDSAKGSAHSAGASLRRHNEQALMEEVRLLLQDWKDMINSSDLLFIRATGTTSRRTLFGPYDDQVLRPKDPRIRGFPFNTRRATQNELMRSFIELTQVKLLEVDQRAITGARLGSSQKDDESSAVKLSKKNTLTPSRITEEEEMAILHTSQIQALIRRNRLPALISYLESNSLVPEFRFHPPNDLQNHLTPTALLLAAHLNSALMVSGLLLKANADPSVKNENGKIAYELASERATRLAFRVARFELGEDKWDWEKLGIPSAISRAEADMQISREKQENERKEQTRREEESKRLKVDGPFLPKESAPLGKAALKGRMIALGQVHKTAQEKREEEARGLTPEMRIRLDRERRARAAEERIKKLARGT